MSKFVPVTDSQVLEAIDWAGNTPYCYAINRELRSVGIQRTDMWLYGRLKRLVAAGKLIRWEHPIPNGADRVYYAERPIVANPLTTQMIQWELEDFRLNRGKWS